MISITYNHMIQDSSVRRVATRWRASILLNLGCVELHTHFPVTGSFLLAPLLVAPLVVASLVGLRRPGMEKTTETTKSPLSLLVVVLVSIVVAASVR